MIWQYHFIDQLIFEFYIGVNKSADQLNWKNTSKWFIKSGRPVMRDFLRTVVRRQIDDFRVVSSSDVF